jgi:hypothetical protein
VVKWGSNGPGSGFIAQMPCNPVTLCPYLRIVRRTSASSWSGAPPFRKLPRELSPWPCTMRNYLRPHPAWDNFKGIGQHWRALKSKADCHRDVLLQFRVREQQELATEQRNMANSVAEYGSGRGQISGVQTRSILDSHRPHYHLSTAELLHVLLCHESDGYLPDKFERILDHHEADNRRNHCYSIRPCNGHEQSATTWRNTSNTIQEWDRGRAVLEIAAEMQARLG